MNAIATFTSRSGRALACALTVLVSALLWCARVEARPLPALVVPPGSGRGLSASIVSQARSLVMLSLERTHRYRVVDLDLPPEPFPRAVLATAALVRQLDARLAVSIDLSRDASTSRTTVALWCVDATGLVLSSLEAYTDAGPESLSPLLDSLTGRLLQEIADDGRAARQAAVAAATPQSPRRPRTPREWSFGARGLLVVPLVSPLRHASTLGGVGAFATVDKSSFLVDFGVQYARGNEAQYLADAVVAALVPFGEREVQPYMGLGLAGVLQRFGGKGATGLQARPSVGLLWGRTQAIVRARFEASYFVDLFTEQQTDRLFPGSDRRHYAHGLLFSAGASF